MTVIVPVRGDRGELRIALDALSRQDYPGEVEIVVVDNGDNEQLPAGGDGVVVIAEPTRSSYAARNAGLEVATGAVLAFTDADCRPDPSWLSRGVETLLAQDHPSFAGGHIEIEVEVERGGQPTGAALWDRLHGLRQDTYVLRDGYAATANLIVTRKVFDAVGPFDGTLRSGGDRDWGERATRAGVRGVYARDAAVYHPARSSLAEVQRKLLRVHRGWAAVQAGRGAATFTAAGLLHRLLPHTRSTLRSAARLGREGWRGRDRARFVATAHWLQYVSLVAWLRAAHEVRPLVWARRGRAADGRPVVLTNILELEGNPYLRLWSAAVRRSGARLLPLSKRTVRGRGADRPAWVHVQWPELVLRYPDVRRAARNLTWLLLLVAIGRARGARVMVTAHNVWSHDRRHPRLETVLWSVLGRLVTDLHLLSAADREEFVGSHPSFRRAARRVIPHGDYGPVVADAPSKEAARAQLGVEPDAKLLFTFGLLKGYKGVEDLLAAFRVLDDPQARLVVAGRMADEALAAELEAARRDDARVNVVPTFLSDAELARWIRAADAVVLPYRRVLNSGSAVLALTLGRRVVLPHTRSFESLRARVGSRWVTLFAGTLAASHLAEAARDRADGAPDLSWCSWDRVTGELARLWRVVAV